MSLSSIVEPHRAVGLFLIGTLVACKSPQTPEAPRPAAAASPDASAEAAAVSRVEEEAPTIDGELDPDLVRRIVRTHLDDVRTCYDAGLARTPALAGRVTIGMTIAPTGSVPTATIAGDTTGDRAVAECVAEAATQWHFPRPRDGLAVAVTYPFTLAPTGDG